MTLSRPFNEDRLALRPSTPSSLLYAIDGCDVLGFVLAGSVSSSSTLQVFREASYLLGLLCPPVNLLGRFPSLRHVHGSSPTEVVEVECRPLIHSSVGLSIPPSFTFCSKLIEPVRMKTHTTTSIVAIECFRGRKRINTTTSLNPRECSTERVQAASIVPAVMHVPKREVYSEENGLRAILDKQKEVGFLTTPRSSFGDNR